MQARTGASLGDRKPSWLVQRNDYRDRGWDTRAGRIEFEVPKLCKESYFHSFLELRRTADKALTAIIQEAYVHGVSIWSVDNRHHGDREWKAGCQPSCGPVGLAQSRRYRAGEAPRDLGAGCSHGCAQDPDQAVLFISLS